MRGLSMIEFMALMFTGLAGVASAVQAYVSYETRGEVARAIVFSERITACADALSAIEPFRRKAGPEWRERISNARRTGYYSLAGLYYAQTPGSPGFKAVHEPRIAAWRDAYARFAIVLPPELAASGAFFDQAITVDMAEIEGVDQATIVTWLERFDREAIALAEGCRGLVV